MFEVGFDAQVIDGGAGQWLVDPASPGFPTRCGDQLVRGVVPGGQVLFGWRLETGTLVGRYDLLSELGYPPNWAGSSAAADANLALVADALRDCGERLTDWTDAAQVARCAAGGTHAALVGRGLDETLTALATEAVPAVP